MARGRRPRSWVRLDCQGILHGSINYIYALDEQAVFIKMIAMAEVYGLEPGLISDNDGRALPKEYVAHELHCSLEVLNSVIAKGSVDKSIEVNDSGIRLLNFDLYQFTEYDRQKPYRVKKESKKYGEFNNVFLTDEEHQKLKDQFGAEVEEKIEALSQGIESKGYNYKSHYAAILSWDRRDKKQEKGVKSGTHRQNSTKLIPREQYTEPPDDPGIRRLVAEDEGRAT